MPTALTENEVLTKHQQSLGEADRACQELGRNADLEYFAPRGVHYRALTTAIKELEGTCRQMAAMRDDARWLRLGITYGKMLNLVQHKYGNHQWNFFNELRKFFVEQGVRNLAELKENRTARVGPILPHRASQWLQMPANKPFLRGGPIRRPN